MSPVAARRGLEGEEEEAGSPVEAAGLASRSLTASLPGETHTLGNVVRSLLIRNPAVEFAGYSVPHPTQVEMNLRIQTTEGPALHALEQALEELTAICEVMEQKYDEALEVFAAKRQTQEADDQPASSPR
ncbi:hypothetical protein Efla_004792 [Eimeria flavescens]